MKAIQLSSLVYLLLSNLANLYFKSEILGVVNWKAEVSINLLISNLSQPPVFGIKKSKPADCIAPLQYQYEGTMIGCYNNSTKSLINSKCQTKTEEYTEINSIPSQNITISVETDEVLCIDRGMGDLSYFSLFESSVSQNQTCPDGMIDCWYLDNFFNKMCLNNTYYKSCPLISIGTNLEGEILAYSSTVNTNQYAISSIIIQKNETKCALNYETPYSSNHSYPLLISDINYNKVKNCTLGTATQFSHFSKISFAKLLSTANLLNEYLTLPSSSLDYLNFDLLIGYEGYGGWNLKCNSKRLSPRTLEDLPQRFKKLKSRSILDIFVHFLCLLLILIYFSLSHETYFNETRATDENIQAKPISVAYSKYLLQKIDLPLFPLTVILVISIESLIFTLLNFSLGTKSIKDCLFLDNNALSINSLNLDSVEFCSFFKLILSSFEIIFGSMCYIIQVRQTYFDRVPERFDEQAPYVEAAKSNENNVPHGVSSRDKSNISLCDNTSKT